MKKILQLLTVFAMTVSSSYADITVNTGADNSTVGALENNGTCSLREALNNANKDASDPLRSLDCTAGSATAADPDTIVFSGVSTINLVDDIFVISDVTIKGPVTISGGGITSMFTVASGSNGKLRIIDNTKLENGNDASGGAIRVNDLENLFQCKNSSFKNNVADNNGGAILSSGILDIDACKFENNRAGRDGGAIWKGGGSSGVATMTINATDFIDNQAGTDTQAGGEGGAIFFSGGTTIGNITTSRFDGNTAQSGTNSSDNNGGGAINNAGVLNITASAFAGNKVNAADANSSQLWHGGAIFNESNGILAVNYSHFGETPLPLPAPFNTLTDANEVTTDGGIGGAIFNFGDMFILGSSFIGNISAYDGGAVGTGTLSDSLFSMVLNLFFEGSTISNSMFSGNMATHFGGAIFNQRDDVLISLINTTVANNSAANGGGLYNSGDGDNFDTTNDEFFLQNTIIANNQAALNANCGGGTTSSEGTNNLVFPAASGCPNSPAINGNPSLSGTPELTFSIPLILNYTLPLGAGSAALGAGDPVVCANFPIINLDQRGFPRPQGDTNCDIGSYESPNIGMPTNTPTNTPTSTSTSTFTASATATSTNTATVTNTATITSTPTQTYTATNTLTATQTFTPSNTVTPTQTFTATNTLTVTNTATATNTPGGPTLTSTPTRTGTQSSTATSTATFTQSSTSTSTYTPTITSTVTSTVTGTLTNTPTNTASFTPSSTPVATETPDLTATATETPSVSATPTLTATATTSSSATVPQNVTPNVTPSSSDDKGCTGTEIKNQQFLLDGQAAQQKRLVMRARALAKKAGAKGAKAVKLDKLVQQATSAYIRMWSGIWSYENVIVKCSNTVLCTSVDITASAKAFSADSDLMVSILNDAVKVLRSVTGNKKSGQHLVKQMKNLDGLNFAALGTLPTTKSVCN